MYPYSLNITYNAVVVGVVVVKEVGAGFKVFAEFRPQGYNLPPKLLKTKGL